MYKMFEFVEKFESIEYTISWKFNEKLCTQAVQEVQIRGKIRIHGMYDLVKIQWEIVYIRCTESPEFRKKLNSLNVGYHENSLENCVHWMDKKSKVIEKYKFSESTVSWKFNE